MVKHRTFDFCVVCDTSVYHRHRLAANATFRAEEWGQGPDAQGENLSDDRRFDGDWEMDLGSVR